MVTPSSTITYWKVNSLANAVSIVGMTWPTVTMTTPPYRPAISNSVPYWLSLSLGKEQDNTKLQYSTNCTQLDIFNISTFQNFKNAMTFKFLKTCSNLHIHFFKNILWFMKQNSKSKIPAVKFILSANTKLIYILSFHSFHEQIYPNVV